MCLLRRGALMAELVVAKSESAVRFGVLGPLLVVDGSGAARAVSAAKQRIVLAALLLGSGRMVSAGELAEALWDISPSPNAPAVMRTYVMRLRRVLGPVGARIAGRSPGWTVELRGPEEFDLAEVDNLRRAAQAAAGTGEWQQASSLLARALSLWRGEPLIDVPSFVLVGREAGRLAELRLQLAEARIDADLRLGRHSELVPELRRLVAEHPLREHIRVQLMLACYGCGQQAAALEVYRDARTKLAEELGVEPGGELRDMHQKMLAGNADLAVPASRECMTCAAEELLIVPRQLPAAPRHFVGRRSELESLARLADDAGEGVVVAVSGMGGVGKTTLALHWAHQVAAGFPDGQLYADLGGFGPSETPVEPALALHGFLDALGVPAERIPCSPDARAALFRSLVAGQRVLMLLDNARSTEQVRPLLPGSPGCLVLVTSRTRLAGLAVGANAELVSLGALSEQEAGDLLAVRLGASRVAGEPEAVTEVIGLCARLPLAVAIAAARAAAYPELPLAALAAELRDAARRLDVLDAGDAASSVRGVLSWSYQQLGELAARMLRLLSAHPGPGITAAAAASMAGVPLGQARHALRALAAANLVTEYLPGRYGLHDLLRAFAAEQAQAAGHAKDHRAAVRRMLDHYLHTANASSLIALWQRDPITLATSAPGVSPERFAAMDQALAWFDAERAVLVKVVGQAAETGFDAQAWQLAWSLAVFFRMRGHWHDLVVTQRVALAAARRLRDQDAQARVHWELGLAIAEAGRFREAHSHLGRALALYQVLGDQDGQARAHISIGLVLARQGRDREALESTLAALHPPSAGTQPPGKTITRMTRAITLNNLGCYHARLGELAQGRTRCEQALQLFLDIGNPYGQGITLESLGDIYHQFGDHDRAIAHYRLAADHYRQAGDLYSLARTLALLGDTCQAVADTAGAHDARQQAIHILDGMHHPNADQTRARLRQLQASAATSGNSRWDSIL